jgi:hypothetical protein
LPNRTEAAIHLSAAAAVAMLLGVSSAAAALSPYYQSAREIEAIVGDQRVADAFKYVEPILSITTAGDDVYEVRTERCALTVTVVDVPTDSGMMGPRQFELQVGKARCQ